MKFSTDTLSVLKNFSTINPSIVFKPGSVVRTISPQKTVMAAATILLWAAVLLLGRMLPYLEGV